MKRFFIFLSRKKLPKWVIENFYTHLNLNDVVKLNKVPHYILDAMVDKNPYYFFWSDIVKRASWNNYDLIDHYFKYVLYYGEFYKNWGILVRTDVLKKHISELKHYMQFVSKYTQLTEEFIEEYEDLIDWEALSQTVRIFKFTSSFLIKHIDKFNTDKLIYSTFVPMQVVIKYPNKFNIYNYYNVISMADEYTYNRTELDSFKELFREQIRKEFLTIMSNI